jgi:hypothetical protein
VVFKGRSSGVELAGQATYKEAAELSLSKASIAAGIQLHEHGERGGKCWQWFGSGVWNHKGINRAL